MIASRLLYEDREMNSQELYTFANDIAKDFNLNIIFKSMSRENPSIHEAVRKVMLTPLKTPEQVYFRQEIITDFLRYPEILGELWKLADIMCTEIENRQPGKTEYQTSRLIDELILLEHMIDGMIQIYEKLETVKNRFTSGGLKQFSSRLEEYDWLAIRADIIAMNFMSQDGKLTLTMSPGRGLKLDQIEINDCVGGKNQIGETKLTKMFHKIASPNVIYLETDTMIKEGRMLEEAATSHLLSRYEEMLSSLRQFYKTLHFELSFYQGCINLHSRFTELSITFCMPIVNEGEKKFNSEELYELTLAIYTQQKPVPNNLAKVDKRLFIITGANQGGKSTFLRSVGIAQLMMQCGMYVPAKFYTNGLYDNIFTHFTRREDQQLNSGRLDEELNRMDKMIDHVTPNSIVLLNESFASTTEKEGSVIADDIVSAFYEKEIDVLMVTHLFEFARKAHEKGLEHAVFLAAERKENGIRTYKMIEEQPNHTSYGLDLYDEMISN